MSKDNCENGFIDDVKYREIYSKRRQTDRQYHVQDDADVEHKDVKMSFDTNQLPTLPFCGSYPNPRGAMGLIKHYYLRFDPKLGHGICAIRGIPYSCVACTSMLEKP